MARYGLSIYGQSIYGAPLLSVFSADPVMAVPTDYGEVLLSWHTPGGDWDELRVIRNHLGYPVAVDNGVEVFTATPDAAGTSVREVGLKQDRWVYYTIFVHVPDDGGQWVRSGLSRCFVPSDYGGAERMFGLIPEIAQSDTLQKYMGVLGYAYDLVRNDINSLLDLYDSMAVSYDLVPQILGQFGIPIEPELGPEQYRRFLRNATFLYKVKGTVPCVHGVVASVTGWQCTVGVGTNLLWTSDYSDFVGGLAGWEALTGATASWVPPTDTDSGALEVTSTASSGAEAHLSERIPVVGGQTYSAAALARALDTLPDEVTIRFDWYDALGGVLGRSFGSGFTGGFYGSDTRPYVPVRQTADTVVRWTEDAPLDAVEVDLVLIVNASASGHRWQWRKVMLNEGGALPYEPGRDIRVGLYITDLDAEREAIHLDRLTKILPRYLPLGATFTLYSMPTLFPDLSIYPSTMLFAEG